MHTAQPTVERVRRHSRTQGTTFASRSTGACRTAYGKEGSIREAKSVDVEANKWFEEYTFEQLSRCCTQIESSILETIATASAQSYEEVPVRRIASRIGQDVIQVERVLNDLMDQLESTSQADLLIEARRRGLIITPERRVA